MGRLPALTVAIAAMTIATGCDVEGKATVTVTKSRREAVQATGPEPQPAQTPPVEAPKPRPPRKLCDGQFDKPGRDLPRQQPSRAAAPGEKLPPAAIPTGGRLTWINLWAAWCVPCKEEMPRLRSFATRLAQAGQGIHLVFISLDDDERQLEALLAAEPAGGMRSTYWLREGREREQWLAQAGLTKDPQLPAHVLVDRRGKIRCVIAGAIEDDDFAQVQAIASP